MTRSISPANPRSLAARIDIARTDIGSTPPRAEGRFSGQQLDPKGRDPKGLDPNRVDTKSTGGGAPRVELDAQFAAEIRDDLRPRDPFRPPLPNPSPDAAITGEARIGIRAKPNDRVTLNVYGRAVAKGQLTDQRAEYSADAVGATFTLRLSPKTLVTAGAEGLHIFGPPAPHGPLDFKATDVTVSATRTLTSKPAAPGRPSVDVTGAFVDRQASRPALNTRSERLTVGVKMPLSTDGPQLVGSYQLRRDDYPAGSNKGQGVWYPVIASVGAKFPLGKSGWSMTPFVEGRVQLSNRRDRDDHNVAAGVRLAWSRLKTP